MKKIRLFSILYFSFIFTLSNSYAKGSSDQGTDAQTRQKMAEMHQKAADCLKSNRSMKECNQEMMQNCPMKGKCDHHSQRCPKCKAGDSQ